MKLPQVEHAIVPERKLTEYLLAIDHVAGGSKARFFIQFGFTQQNWRQLAQALKRHAPENEISAIQWIRQGQLYVVEGPMVTPIGRRPDVRSVWVIRHGEAVPTLSTAYPLGRRKP